MSVISKDVVGGSCLQCVPHSPELPGKQVNRFYYILGQMTMNFAPFLAKVLKFSRETFLYGFKEASKYAPAGFMDFSGELCGCALYNTNALVFDRASVKRLLLQEELPRGKSNQALPRRHLQLPQAGAVLSGGRGGEGASLMLKCWHGRSHFSLGHRRGVLQAMGCKMGL